MVNDSSAKLVSVSAIALGLVSPVITTVAALPPVQAELPQGEIMVTEGPAVSFVQTRAVPVPVSHPTVSAARKVAASEGMVTLSLFPLMMVVAGVKVIVSLVG